MKEPSLSPKNWSDRPGVYLMKDRSGTVLYVGKAKSLKKRLAGYFRRGGPPDPKTSRLVAQIASLETRVTASEVEALLLESRLVKDLQPRYNIELKDDKSFPFLVAALEQDFPRVFLTRQPAASGETRFGPFTDAAGLAAAFRALQAVFRFRTCTLSLADGEKRRRRPCLLHAVARCTGPCAGLITPRAYRQDIDDLLRFLKCERDAVLAGMEHRMGEASTALEYERAASLRDQLAALRRLGRMPLAGEATSSDSLAVDPRTGQARLQLWLSLPALPRILAGIDISCLGGQDVTGSLVCFIDGRPFPQGYRRFRIREPEARPGDPHHLGQVVKRYFTRLARERRQVPPDVLLLDGGLPQLHAALKQLAGLPLLPGMVVALAKKEEVIYQPDRPPLKLPRNDPGLQLLQAVRDEAHRFARSYHHVLRTRRTVTR